jgi:hypothetical protein
MPELLEVVPSRARRWCAVASALVGHAWIGDIVGVLTIAILMQYLHLRQKLEDVSLSQGVADMLIWKWTTSGQYSSSSAYAAMFLSQPALLGAKELWKVKAPNEFMFFLWLAMQDLCDQLAEMIDHLLLGCVFNRELWFRGLHSRGW